MVGFENLFVQVAAALTVAVVLGLIATLLKQPLIVAFIATGILVGPEVLGIIEAPNEIALLAKIGISILLFVVGLKLDVREIRMVGPVALATGLGQVVFTSVFGFVIALALGFDVVPALYIAVALTFSSTIIIVKLLSDKRELDHLHGRIAIGFLIVQDIAVVLAMIALTAFDVSEGSNPMSEVVGVLVRGGALVIGLGAVMRWVLPPVVHRMAHSAELLVLFAIAWAVALAAVTDLLGFSEEVGAFLAGMSLASTPYREAIGGRLTSLRDFLLLFFFIDIGTTLEVGLASSQLVAATLLSLFVLIGNPIIVMVIMGLMRYPKRVAFLAGLTVAQISEFSLILAALGRDLGQLDDATVGLITTVGMITITASTYMILNSEALFQRLSPLLSVFERQRPDAGPPPRSHDLTPEAVVVGLGRFGREVVEELLGHDCSVVGVDFDPVSVRNLQQLGVPVVYGDAEDPELAAALPLSEARWVVSTVRGVRANLSLLRSLRDHHFAGRIALSADSEADVARLEAAGADLVLHPFRSAATPIVARLVEP
jgi:Kef-type K+ transport system membrane component KefB